MLRTMRRALRDFSFHFLLVAFVLRCEYSRSVFVSRSEFSAGHSNFSRVSRFKFFAPFYILRSILYLNLFWKTRVLLSTDTLMCNLKILMWKIGEKSCDFGHDPHPWCNIFLTQNCKMQNISVVICMRKSRYVAMCRQSNAINLTWDVVIYIYDYVSR